MLINRSLRRRLVSDGVKVHHIGRVGADDLGERMIHQMKSFGVNTRFVTITEGVSSGVAMILVEKNGENRIISSAGATRCLHRQISIARNRSSAVRRWS